jgi:hypothetical protein
MNDQQRAAMQMALDGLVWYSWQSSERYKNDREIILALREALAQSTNSCQNSTKLVETQPQGEWVDLTDDEVDSLREVSISEFNFACAVIAKFKLKNTPPVVPQGEPVAWMDSDGFPWTKEGVECRTTPDTYIPLYTTPPSVEVAIETKTTQHGGEYPIYTQQDMDDAIAETLEKAANVCDGFERKKWKILAKGGVATGFSPADCAAAIRSMK